MRLLRTLPLFLLLLAFAPAVSAQEASDQSLNDRLYAAVRAGDVAAVKAALDGGADVNAKFRYGATALFKAAERGNAEVVKLLLERGADVSVKDTFYGATAMTWALGNGHVGVVRLLLERGAGTVDEVLMSGVRESSVELVRIALDKGGARPETLTSALVAATNNDKADIADLLKKAGAQPPPEVDAATLASYAGQYKPEQGNELTVTVKDGKLQVTPTGQRTIDLMPLDQKSFKPLAFDGLLVTFDVDGGKTVGLTIKQGANTTKFKRVEPAAQP